MELSENAWRVLEKRYLKRDASAKPLERPEDMFRRVASVVAGAEANFGAAPEQVRATEEAFYGLMTSLEFLPNSPTLMNAGRDLGQLSACFVLPVQDSIESIFETIKHTAIIHKSGGGTGFTFSNVRPKNDRVQSTMGISSGPVSFIGVFNAATEAIKQGGTRRGANMAILSVTHPDILEFIDAKTDQSALNNFNISVGVTEEFMRAVEQDLEFETVNPRTGNPVARLKAKEIFHRIAQRAWENGDPGIVFLDRLERDNPTPALGKIEATNPCGEQPLLPYEACNLGSINLAKMLKRGEGGYALDWDKFRETIHLAIRFLDDVVEVNRYPLKQIEDLARGNRKVGLGVMGFADLLLRLEMPYDSPEAERLAEQLMSFMQKEALQASIQLARERGPFPNFPGSVYDKPGQPQVRNASRTTIAPTGTIGLIAGCSSGIEPLFALAYVRRAFEGDQLRVVDPLFREVGEREGWYTEELADRVAETGSCRHLQEVPEEWRGIFVTAHDIAPEWHVRIQAAFQRATDNAVSKTINFPNSATVEDIKNAYMLAYKLGCKGITVYRDGSRDEQVLKVSGGEKKDAESMPGGDGITPRPRPEVTIGVTHKMKTGCGNLYVTLNEDDRGLCEVFTSMGKAGGCAGAQAEAIARLVSLALRAGVKGNAVVKHLRGIRCANPAWSNGGPVLSCPDALGLVLERYTADNEDSGLSHNPGSDLQQKALASGGTSAKLTATLSQLDQLIGACPDCGGSVHYEEGCVVCPYCGWSKC